MSTPESRLLDILAGIAGSVWFDPGWDAGVVREFDGVTWRITSMLSRPIHTQYLLEQPSLPIAPAEAFSPNGKRVLSLAGAQYMAGAAALAALLQGSAVYSEIHLVNRMSAGAGARWSAHQAVAAPDNRVLQYITGAPTTSRWRSAAGAATANSGSNPGTGQHTMTTTYNGSDHDAWLDSASETLSAGGANTRAPATLNEFSIGAIWSAGVYGAFWTGHLAGLVMTPGHVLSTDERVGLETELAAYYGY